MRVNCVLAAVVCAGLASGERVKQPEYIGAPVGLRAVDQRAFTGISSMAVAANGRLWATWYAGPSPAEDENNYVVLSTSADDGKTWKELLVVDPDGEGPRRTFDPEVWISPDGQLHWIWADRTGDDQRTVGTWIMSFPNALDEPARPAPARCIANGVSMCKPIVLKDGAWALPNCEWFTDRSSGMTVSTDNGRTWTFRGGASMPQKDREFDEHNFVQLKNGDVRVYSRAKSGPRTAVSHDAGATWSELVPTKAFRNTNTRFFVQRLKSGNLLLVKNGPRDQNVGRKQLTAFVSRDDGATWEGGLLLEKRGGATYPDGQQRADGLIYVTYDFDRSNARTIYFCTFTEEDVLAGKPVSGKVRLREVISKGTGRPAVPAKVYPPDAFHGVNNRAHVGIASFAVSPRNGRMWACWYGGITPGEDQNNYVTLSTSADEGKTWKEVLVCDPDLFWPRRAFDSELWISPDGKLRWTWTDRIGTVASDPANDQLWMLTLDAENEPPKNLPRPELIGRGVMMCKPTVLANGEMLFPSAWWQQAPSARFYSTRDCRSFAMVGGATLPPDDRLFDEHQMVQLKNGDLWCLIRGRKGLWESRSTDNGRTWSEAQAPAGIRHTSSRLFFTRLASGNLLLVKHGPIDRDVGRKELAAYISQDDGQTWSAGLMLDARGGISYPDGQQMADGRIAVIYDYNRVTDREVHLVLFTEADVLAGATDRIVRRRVTKSTGSPQYRPVADNKDGAPMLTGAPGAFAEGTYKADVLKAHALLFTDRKYRVAPGQLAKCLDGLRFLRVPLMGEQELTVAKAGVVGVLSPLPNRNCDSCMASLEQQGFRRVALPEIRLFDPRNPGNFVSYWQKTCAAGEKVRVGKWGVPVWAPGK